MTPKDRVLDHYQYPYHRHIPNKFYEHTLLVRGRAKNESCGDWIKWWGKVDYTPEKRIVALWWDGEGCIFSQAMPSMLAEHCEAKRLAEVEAFTQDDMLALFGVDIEPGRIECVMVAYHALQKALRSYRE